MLSNLNLITLAPTQRSPLIFFDKVLCGVGKTSRSLNFHNRHLRSPTEGPLCKLTSFHPSTLPSWPTALVRIRQSMRYTRSLRDIGKVLASSRPPILSQFRPRNLQIHIRYSSSAAGSTGMLYERYPRPKPSTDISATPDMETINTTERLTRLRELMKEHKVDIYSM